MTDRIEEPEVSREEVEETAEVVEEAPVERVQLEEATVEPKSEVERTGDYEQSEAIEAAVVEVIEAVGTRGDSLPQEEIAETREDRSPSGDAADRPPEELAEAGEDRTSGEAEGRPTEDETEVRLPALDGTSEELPGGREEAESVAEERAPGGEVEVFSDVLTSREQGQDEQIAAVAEDPESEEARTDVTDQMGLQVGEDEIPESNGDPPIGPEQTLDLQADLEGPEVGEYWEPPEMYIYESPDGSIEFVYPSGNPVISPPNLVSQPEGSSSSPYQAWYPGSDSSEIFEVPKYTPKTNGLYAYYGQDGSVTLVEGDGTPVLSPPELIIKGVPKPIELGPDGNAIVVSEYRPPLFGVYAYISDDGSVSIVDEDGQLIDCPPHYDVDVGQGKVYTQERIGPALEIPKYVPSLTGIYAYTGQDGTVMIVDKDGKLIDSPPSYDVDALKGDVYTKGSDGSAIEIPGYKPPMDDVFVYTAQDGSISIVDVDGMLIDSPPHVQQAVNAQGKTFYYAEYPGVDMGPNPVELKNFKPVSSH